MQIPRRTNKLKKSLLPRIVNVVVWAMSVVPDALEDKDFNRLKAKLGKIRRNALSANQSRTNRRRKKNGEDACKKQEKTKGRAT